MRAIKGIKLRVPGEFNDAFLYGKYLYLIDDENLYVVDFRILVTSILPEDPEIRVLARYAFLNNDFFYKADSDFFDFFNLKTIRTYLQGQFDNLRDLGGKRIKLKEFIVFSCPHKHKGAYHLEVYKHAIFISGDDGVFSYTLIGGRLMREAKLLSFPAYHIGASYGNNVYFSCGENGLKIQHMQNFGRRSSLAYDYEIPFKIQALGVEFAYSDLIVRDINNDYHYEYNTISSADRARSNLSSKDLAASYKAIDGNLIHKPKILTVNGNKVIKVTDEKVEIFKLNYFSRQHGEPILNELFEAKQSWDTPQKIGEIYTAFQTVFGFVIDTDVGSMVIDDDIENSEQVVAYTISSGENVKIRHFYRSINYSHLLLNIKNNFLEIYTDLSDYFFPAARKNIRRYITRHQAKKAG